MFSSSSLCNDKDAMLRWISEDVFLFSLKTLNALKSTYLQSMIGVKSKLLLSKSFRCWLFKSLMPLKYIFMVSETNNSWLNYSKLLLLP